MATKQYRIHHMEQMLQVARWSPNDVEKFLLKKRLPLAIAGAFRMIWKINGEQLLNLEEPKIREICAQSDSRFTNTTIAAIAALQSEYDRAYELAKRSRKRKRGRISKNVCRNGEEPPFKRRRQSTYKKAKSSSKWYHEKRKKMDYDISSSGERWDECTLREAWFWYLPPNNKNFEEIARLLKRTEVAVLSRINLIRRACKERPEMEEEIKNPLWKTNLSLRMVVTTQAAEERKRYQEERMRQNKEEQLDGYAPVERGSVFHDDDVKEMSRSQSASSSDSEDTAVSVRHEQDEENGNKENHNKQNGNGNGNEDTENQMEDDHENEEDEESENEKDDGVQDDYEEIERLVHELLRERYLGGKGLRKKVAEIMDIGQVPMKVYYKALITKARDSFYSSDEDEDY